VRIIGHRGAAGEDIPENTIGSFQRALDLGADGVELDVRLTSDFVPVVHHSYYLDPGTGLDGIVSDHPWGALKPHGIPALLDVLRTFAGRIFLEIEVKGPEPEAAKVVADMLRQFRSSWDAMEVTSFEPALLRDLREGCPGLAGDLLMPRSEDWMGLDVVETIATQKARLAGARAVHLHTSQIRTDLVDRIRARGIDVHAHGVKDPQTYDAVQSAGIRQLGTDQLRTILDLRRASQLP
jgi:glycerophosphoryl diester phosphodiesterase